MATSLPTKLYRAEESARQQCAELSRQMDELQERLAMAQRRLDVSIAREERTAPESAEARIDALALMALAFGCGHLRGGGGRPDRASSSPGLRRGRGHRPRHAAVDRLPRRLESEVRFGARLAAALDAERAVLRGEGASAP
ncbi:hypothetical protein [Nonomuraea jabiensis]|uniref:hypothetical protein n=1 Tax=Nonomuraea jabiensis TaxID=882448 RepID=UPI00368783E6